MTRAPSARVGPPMGWNSWDAYGTTVTEAEVLANAEFLAEHLLPFGWDTVVVDIDWSNPTARSHGYNTDAPLAMDEYGRLVPDPGRFPSAGASGESGGRGFGPLAERIHALGLRFGIHTMRGIPRRAVVARTPIEGTDATAAEVADPGNACDWNPDMVGLDHENPAAQAYYDSTLRLYAEWGVDFVKADDMLWPYQAADIEAYARAIERCGRPIELSLSPGRDLSPARLDHLRAHAAMWRICDDLWDRWEDVRDNVDRLARWAPHAGEHGWPDGDMLPLGRIGIRAERGEPRDSRLTPDEQRTLMTLWIIARSPLMIGGELPSSSPETVALFTNADALAVLHSTGSRQVRREGALSLWTADGAAGERYAAVLNLGDDAAEALLDVGDLGFPTRPDAEVRELWTGLRILVEPVATRTDARGVASGSGAMRLALPVHGSVLLRAS